MKMRFLILFSFIATVICSSCWHFQQIPRTELTDHYRILVAEYSDLNDINSVATEDSCIFIPTLYEVTLHMENGKLQERMDFVRIWTETNDAWYLLGRWNAYMKIDISSDTLISSDKLDDFEVEDRLIFQKLLEHPELFTNPQIRTESHRSFEWNDKGYVNWDNVG